MAGTDGTATYPWLNVPSETADGAEPKPATNKADVVAPVPRVCLSRSEAARALGIGLSTLLAWERAGIAPPSFVAPPAPRKQRTTAEGEVLPAVPPPSEEGFTKGTGQRLYPVRSLIEWAEKRAAG